MMQRAVVLLWMGLYIGFVNAESLQKSFDAPPKEARPHTWWHWMNGNVTKEGITADIESMARVGIGGAQIFNVNESIPVGPVNYLSPQWLDLVSHAAREAKRVGIELCFHNCAGWSSSGGPWITPALSMQKVVWTETKVSPDSPEEVQLPQPQAIKSYYRDIAVLAFPDPANDSFRIERAAVKAGFETEYGIQPEAGDIPADAVIALDRIVNLSEKMDRSGKLTWKSPGGSWTILRIGHTTTGKTNHPSPDSGLGLECDKLSREALDAHWNGGIQPVLDKLGSLAGNVLNNILIDSYEVGLNNWTPRMCDEFRLRRGYDLIPYLPAMTGRVVAGGLMTERFLWDYRRTIADLFEDNYYGYFAEKCHQHGLLCSTEPYDGPFECMAVGKKADIIMGEFWVDSQVNHSVKLAASVAHTHGKNIVGAESFTSGPQEGRWQNYPGSLKMLGDMVWCTGVNRYIFHRYAHQPWLDKFPGMTMGQWGTNFERTNTWWESSKSWMTYITRCQFLLQQGQFAADVLYFVGETAPNGSVSDPDLRNAGYDFDMCGTDLIDSLSVKDGMLVLPGGMRYRLLVMPRTRFMTPQLAEKIRDLIAAGATVIAPRPELSPSLTGYPESDRTVQQVADQVWGPSGQGQIGERTFGQGLIAWASRPLDILRRMDISPDCAPMDSKVRIAYIHRMAGQTDIYFVSHQDNQSRLAEVFFRVSGRLPELWNPVTGNIIPAGLWHTDSKGTFVTLPLGPAGSVFVVFRNASAGPVLTVEALRQETPKTIADMLPENVKTLKIVKASYGVLDYRNQGGVEVTDILAKSIHDNQLDIVAGNDLAGDPKPNVSKCLYVDYEYDGNSARIETKEGQHLILPPADSPKGRTLKIIKAVYGKLPERQAWFSEPKSIDITSKVIAAVRDNRLDIQADNAFAGKDPAYNVTKQMQVSYTLDGKADTVTIDENSRLILPQFNWHPAAWMPELTCQRKTATLLAWDNGCYVLTTTDGRNRKIDVDSLPDALILDKPWTVEFAPGRGAPDKIELQKLLSLTELLDPGVKYYSGTASYRTVLTLSDESIQSSDRVVLDLGQVCYLAEVFINGHNLGVLWSEPYRIDVTDVIKAGNNRLEIRVTNLWTNRLIGDEQYPDDCQWNGKALKEWPQWLIQGKKRPVWQRLTFTTWKHWTKNDELKPSGLMGPVYLRMGKEIKVDLTN